MDGGYTNIGTAPVMILTWGEEVKFGNLEEITWDGGTLSHGTGWGRVLTSKIPGFDATPKLVRFTLGSEYFADPTDAPESSKYVCVSLNQEGSLKNGTTYFFTIPAGVFVNEDGVGNPEQTFTYTKVRLESGLVNNPSWFSPTPTLLNTNIVGGNFELGELDKVTIAPSGATLKLAPGEGIGQLPLRNTDTGEAWCIENGVGIENGKFVLDLSSISRIPGLWEVFMPGSVGYVENGGEISSYGGSILKFRIIGDDDPEYLPEDVTVFGSIMGYPMVEYNQVLPTVHISWNGVPFDIDENKKVFYRFNGKTFPTTLRRTYRTVNGETEFFLQITPDSQATEAGVYDLVIPAGTVVSGVSVNRELILKVLLATPFSSSKLTPPSGSSMPYEDFSGIVVEFPGATTITVNPDAETECTWQDGPLSPKALPVGEKLFIEGNKLVIPMSLSSLSSSTYTLAIPKNKFVIDGLHLNMAISGKYSLKAPEFIEVHLYVNGAPGLENVEDYIDLELIRNPETGTTKAINLTNGWYGLGFNDNKGFKLTPHEGYKVKVKVNPAALAKETIVNMGTYTVIDLPYKPELNNAVFTATVSEITAQSETEVTLNYTAGDGVEGNVWEYVEVSVEELGNDGGGYEEDGASEGPFLTPNANPFVFTVTPTATVSFAPIGGYLVEVTSEDVEEGVLEIQSGKITSAILFEDAPEEVSFMLNVTLDPMAALNGPNAEAEDESIYNPQGIRVDRHKLIKGDVYIIGGKKVMVK